MAEAGYSMVKAYRRCPRLYEFRYKRNLVRLKPAVPLIRGTILHAMLDARSVKGNTKSPLDVLAEYEEKYSSLFREEREIYGEDFIKELRRIYKGYERTYKNDGLKYLASEEFVATDLPGGIRYTGHLDKRVLKDGRLWIMDHKTHKNFPTEEQRFQDYQILMYVWAYNREHKDQIDGIIWDYIRTKPPAIPEVLKNGQLSQRMNMDTDYRTYLRKLVKLGLDVEPYEDFLIKLKQRSKDRFYKRVYLPNPGTKMVEQVVKDFIETATEMTTRKYFPRTMTRDCSFCEYYRLCAAELRGLDAKFIQKTEFKIEERPPAYVEEE